MRVQLHIRALLIPGSYNCWHFYIERDTLHCAVLCWLFMLPLSNVSRLGCLSIHSSLASFYSFIPSAIDSPHSFFHACIHGCDVIVSLFLFPHLMNFIDYCILSLIKCSSLSSIIYNSFVCSGDFPDDPMCSGAKQLRRTEQHYQGHWRCAEKFDPAGAVTWTVTPRNPGEMMIPILTRLYFKGGWVGLGL